MEFVYLLLVILVIWVVLSIFLGLLSSPVFWIVIAVIFIVSAIRRYLYAKQMDEYNKEWEAKNEQKKKAYKAQEDYRNNTGDVIDADYKEFDDDDK
ncbi:MAG: hypothetical protein PHH04_00540 [Thomasclavelia sp.]|jgi:phosphate/sulfate permease|nr:hypothetical protein [Thomasclavelia sp.]